MGVRSVRGLQMTKILRGGAGLLDLGMKGRMGGAEIIFAGLLKSEKKENEEGWVIKRGPWKTERQFRRKVEFLV